MKNSKFSLKNFRVFGDEHSEFEIAPITILTGTNSSGKSSVIKSLMLLSNFFEVIDKEFHNNKKFVLNDHKLLFQKGKHKLGNFEHTKSYYSKNKEIMSFSWSKYSNYLLNDINVTFNFTEDKDDFYKNPNIGSIIVTLADNVIVNLDFSEEFDFNIDYDTLKKYFFQLVSVVKHYKSIDDSLEFNQVGGKNGFKSEDELYNTEGISQEAVESYLYIRKNIPNKDYLKEFFSGYDKISDDCIKYKSLLYLPIIKLLDETKKKDLIQMLWDKFSESDLEDKLNEDLLKSFKTLINEFIESNYESFYQYFFEIIEDKLIKGFSSSLKGHNNKNSLISFHRWLIEHSNTKGEFNDVRDFFKWSIEGASSSFVDEIFKFISINENISNTRFFDFETFVLDRYPKEYEDYMILSYISALFYPEFSKERWHDEDLRPITQRPSSYIEPIEYELATKFITAFIYDSVFNFPSYISNVDFIEAVRVNINRIFSFEKTNEFSELVSNYLKNASEVKSKSRKIIPSFSFEYQEKEGLPEFNIKKEMKLKTNSDTTIGNLYIAGSFMRKWINEFEIADDVKFEDTKDGLGTLIYLVKSTKKELLADQGYGVSQFLAIILNIELSIIKNQFDYSHPLILGGSKTRYKESVLTIEEPEVNLHPKLQSKLADMFIDAYKTYNVRFMLETHSEYLIRKLQTLVAKKEISSDEVAIHYIYNPDKKKRPKEVNHVEKINILEDGRLDRAFGNGFYDEADNLALDLLTIKSLN